MINNTSPKNSRISPSFFVALVYIIVLLLHIRLFNNALHAIFLIWLISVLVFDGKKLSKIISLRYYISIYIFIIYFFVSSMFAFSPSTCLHRVFTSVELISPFIMYELYRDYRKKWKWAVFLIFVVIFVVYTRTVMVVSMSSSIAGIRQHVGDDDFIIGGFNFIYYCVLLFATLILILKRRHLKSSSERIVVIIWMITIVLTVVRSMYTTAFLLLFFGVLISILYGKKHWKRKMLVGVGVIMAVGVFFIPFVERFLLSINTNYSVVTVRLQDVHQGISGELVDTGDSSLLNRIKRFITSLETFFTYPIFGVNHLTADEAVFDNLLIGNHSEWVDSMAQYGVFSFFLFYFLIKSAQRVSNGRDLNAVFVLFIVMGFFNQCLIHDQTMVCFFVIPIIYDILTPHTQIDLNNYTNKVKNG